MRHSFIDRFSNLDSFIHRIDSRVKIVVFFIFILFIIFTPPELYITFGLYGFLVFILILLSRIPLGFVFKRSMGVIAFVALAAISIPFLKKGEVAGAYSLGSFKLTVSYGGLAVLWNVSVKSYLSILNIILLMNCTKFPDMLKAFENLKVPRLFIMVLSFMYRYVFLFMDELMRMKQAKDARAVGGSHWLNIKALANMVGALFVRAYERGENVYIAMCSRGFTGEAMIMGNTGLRIRDFCFLFGVVIMLMFIRILGGRLV